MSKRSTLPFGPSVVDFAVLIGRIMFHSRISKRPLELLALPSNGVPKQLLNIGQLLYFIFIMELLICNL